MEQNVFRMHLEKEDMNVLRSIGMRNFLVLGIQILAKLQRKIFWKGLENQMLYGLEQIVQVILLLPFRNIDERTLRLEI